MALGNSGQSSDNCGHDEAACRPMSPEDRGPSVTPLRTKRQPGDGTVRIGTAAAIPAVLRNLGVDPVEVFAQAKMDPELFGNPDNVISFAARGRLIQLCVMRTGCSHFGLLIGERVGLPSMGAIGYLTLHSPDVGSALRSLVHHFHLQAQGAAVALHVSDGVAFLSYSVLEPGTPACDQVEDGAVAIAFNSLRRLCGPDWRATEVRFAHRKPKDLGPFRRFFRAPLRFDADDSGVAFPAEWMNKPVPESDPELHRLLVQQVNSLEAAHCRDFPDQVRRVLGALLLTGNAQAEDVATLFSMSNRTLRRRLQACNTSFHEVAEAARFEIARQMLEVSEAEVGQIAMMLGYADQSSFSRAFKRWSGLAPSVWRSSRPSSV